MTVLTSRFTVCHLTTVAMSLRFLRGQMRFLNERGFDGEVIASPDVSLGQFATDEGVRAHPVRMQRRITPVSKTNLTIPTNA